MSTRLQEDLRRIVGVDDAGIPIPRQEEKKPIPGGRGIVYFDNKGNSQVSSGTPPVVNEDGTVDPGTTQPGGGDSSGGTSGGGSNGGNTLPAGSEPTPIADGAEGGGVYSVDSDAGVIDANLGDTVKGVSGLVDCESGDPVDLRFDGEFSAPNGCGIPPEGYEEGSYWDSSGLGQNNPSSDAAESPQGYIDNLNPSLTWRYVFTSETSATVEWDNNGTWVSIGSITRRACSGVAGGEDYCTIPPPGTPTEPWPDANTPPGAETQWPSCKPSQLSYNNETAKFETNSFDGNVLPKFSQPVSQVTLCNEAGDTIKTFPTADGGHVIFNQDNNIGVFLNDQGVVTGYGDGPAVTARQPR